VDWSLRGCARHGHVTFAPDEPDLAARLHADTGLGPAWRCLRCGAFVLGGPDGSGPAAAAPRVLRGRALREATVLRLFAVERFVRAAGLLLLAWGVLRFRSSEATLQAEFDRLVPAARPLARLFDLNLDTSPTVARLRDLLHSDPRVLAWLAAALLGYAGIEALEGVGLWSLQRWGEYVAAVATSVFLPIEVYELSHHVTAVRLAALGINVALVVYLVVAKRLFGVRGGAAAAARERAADSLLEVEASAAATARRTRFPPGRP
jgi:uncharacterized membrane protein (DUF2068 family)